MRTLYLCGAGNSEGVRLALRVNAATSRWDRVLLLDDDVSKRGESLLGVPIVGTIDELLNVHAPAEAVNLVARTTARRAAVRERIEASGVPLASLVHPSVDASECSVAPGALVYEQAILSTATRLGLDSVVFMRAVVGHDVSVGEGCVVASGAVLNARVVLETQVYVGSNASVLPDARIGARTTIGANSLVVASVPADASVVGVPGQVVRAAERAESASNYAEHVAPTRRLDAAALEAEMLPILREVLRAPQIEAQERFFEIGGTSLLAVEFVTLLGQRTGRQVPLVEFFASCSVRELARRLAGGADDAPSRRDSSRVDRLQLLAQRRERSERRGVSEGEQRAG